MDDFDEFKRHKDNDSFMNDEIDFDNLLSDDEKDNELAELNEKIGNKNDQNKIKKEEDLNLDLNDNDEEGEVVNHNDDEEDDIGENGCAYCGVGNGKNLIKCNDKNCQKWFCNGTADNYSPSHIVFHLTKSKHKEVCTSANSDFGKMVLVCYNCNIRNIFLLGFLESKDKKTGIILCREPCLATCKLEDDNFEKNSWKPLITDKKLLEWIIPSPDENELYKCQKIGIRKMTKLEDRWIEDILFNNKKTYENEEKQNFVKPLKNIKLTYENGQDYIDTFEPLITREEEYDKKIKENQKKIAVKASFSKRLKKVYAKFIFPREDNEYKLVPGDELMLSSTTNSEIKYKGYITKLEIDDEVQLELEKISKVPADGMYLCEVLWKGTSFKRMLEGIYQFVNDKDSISSYLYHKILGQEVEEKKVKNIVIPKDISIKEFPDLNYYQTLAIKKALQSPLFLIQGPPGTGKTVTSAAIVHHLAMADAGMVLVCAPSNIAADQLSYMISKTNIRVVRVCSKSREAISTNVEYLSLHQLIRTKWNNKDAKRLLDLIKAREDQGELSQDNYELYRKLKNKAELDVMNNAQVVVTTCITALDKRLNNYRFPFVLVDEATQACESECLLPLLKGAKQVILVGDHCQLGPVVLCKDSAKAGMKMSLFERLVKLKVKPHMLQVQYRMHPRLSEFPSNTFYNGNLQNGISPEDRVHLNVNFNWPNPNKPLFFYHVCGVEQFSQSGTSYLNIKEAEFIEKAVTSLLKSNVKPEQIGIITPYEGQRSYIVSHMIKNGSVTTSLYKEIEVASVDSFQGREKDYILLSCVRSNDNHGIGFLNDPRRLNVALTRARYGLIIVGNANALSKHTLWNNLLYHFKSNGVLVEGNLQGFRELIITLKEPEKYVSDKGCFESQLKPDFGISTLFEKGQDIVDDDLLNDATFSRFSEFGYSNDKESIDHHMRVKEKLKKNPFKTPVLESLRSKFDITEYNNPEQNRKLNNIISSNFYNIINNMDSFNKLRNVSQSYDSYGNSNFEVYKEKITALLGNEKQFVLNTEF